jgi:hypothetical protein
MQRVLWGNHAVQQLVASAYQHGFNDGFALAVKEEVLELEAAKREEERQAIINWQGICESREGCECGCDD